MATSPDTLHGRRLAQVVSIDADGHRARVLARRDDLVARHEHLLGPIARKIKQQAPETVLLEDLISIGMIALVQAATRFRPDAHGNPPFESYARPWIRGAMLNSINGRNWTAATCQSIDTAREPGAAPIPAATDAGAAASSVFAHVLARKAEAAIELLPAAQRAVLKALYSEDEPSLAEIGRRMGKSARWAQHRHSEAIEALRDMLDIAARQVRIAS